MQFVKNGPDIPERLLQAHEDGQVVFFCGAGISYPAGLPGFEGLVDQVYGKLNVQPNPIQEAAIKSGRFDTAIGLLEAEIIGERKTVRQALAKILTPATPIAPAATVTHEALLTLGKNREGRTRLVTTNFDRLFEEVIASKALNIERFQAPLLPTPKKRWDGLVYLHGLLSAKPSKSELDRLVVSSGDFGLAYLTERWAARFVSELFRRYSVCFVGYSLNDPVLRYMMDALAADRLLGESSPEMFAFGSFSKRKEQKCENEWRTRNVTPILYREYRHHAYLHRTLRAWAETYRDGVGGKEYIAAQYAMARPSKSTQQDNFVARMRWALSDPSGLPAKRFAEFDPAPSLDWLKPLSESAYGHADLARFGVPPEAAVDDELAFSLINRPSPYPLAPWMCVVDNGVHGSDWDKVMPHLAHWLTRHLDDPALLLWLAERGDQLHEDMVEKIERHLNKLYELERDGKTAELARIRENAPRAIPGAPMRTLWRFMLTGHMKSALPDHFGFTRWRERFQRDGLTPSLRLELRKMLTPRIALSKPSRRPDTEGETDEPTRIKDLVDWEIMLSTDDVHSNLRDLSENENVRWTAALPGLLSDFSTLLRDALDLRRELDGINDKSDRSYVKQPSISEHEQNRKFCDWTALIDLNRDAWLATAAESPAQATLVAEFWSNTPYPLFRRLAFFAAAQDGVIPLRRALEWLLADECWWLWSVETRREALRLLVSLAPRLDDAMRRELEQAVLNGPPREMFIPDIEPERWTLIEDREIWLRLAKIDEAGAVLSEDGEKRMEQIQAKYPDSNWALAEDQRDEFSGWMRIGDVSELRNVTSPRRRRELTEWLRQRPSADPWQPDDWRQRCRDHFATSACALYALVREDFWPKDRWREALEVWSEGKHRKRSWRYMAPVVATVPDAVLQALANTVSYWLQAIAETFKDQTAHEARFFALVKRILALNIENDINTGDLVGQAINHPVGHVTQALLNWWYRGSLKDGQGLPEELKARFTGFCDTRIDKFRHARVLLAANVIALFRVDRDWASQHLLPLFDWKVSQQEARAAWQSFLWSPRLYRPLMEALKPDFLDTATHYEELGKYPEQYAALLASAALDRGDTFTKAELASATRSLPANGLHNTARVLVRALKSAGDQRANYWSNRVAPYLREIWPQTRNRVSPEISESLGQLCVAAQDQFPEALAQLQDWLQAADYPDSLVHWLYSAGLCGKSPEQALEFLNRVVGEQKQRSPRDLNACLEAIESASPELKADQRFERLSKYLRQCSPSN